jgi:Asp-tRNA(Asn)/Glu-tRNA(Gln) amidotransferase A subunit family amidase
MLSRRRFLTGTATAALALAARPDELTATPKGVSSEADDAMLSLGAREAVARIQKGEMKAEFYVARLLKHYDAHKDLNTVIPGTMDENRVLVAARAIDQARTKGEKLGMLAGLPVLVKDQADVAGYPTTAGNGELKGYVAKKNAAVVETLVQNGAIVFAKGNCAVVIGAIQGTGATSSNPYFGFVHNPYDMRRIPGGSSGGNAAALAARIVPAALGADAGGSVRGPSSCCGTAGLRPSTYTTENALNGTSRKRYSSEGELPPPQLVDTFGPMARSVADVAFLDAVLTGEATPSVDLKGARIGVPRADYWERDVIDPEVLKVTQTALAKLRDAGAQLIEYDLNALLALDEEGMLNRALRRPNNDLAEWLAVNAPEVKMADLNRLRDSFPPICIPTPAPLSDSQRTKVITDAARRYTEAFKGDGLLAITFPTLPIRPPLINSNGDTPYQKILLNGKWVEEHASIAFNLIFAPSLGAPSLSLPSGMVAGLPTGLSLQGLPGDDGRILGLGIAVERVLGPLPPPPFLNGVA